MRTTIELTNEQRAKLLAIAARRGEKGFSKIIQQAVDQYLEKHFGEEFDERKRRALAALGSWSDEQADEVRAEIRKLRKTWRAS